MRYYTNQVFMVLYKTPSLLRDSTAKGMAVAMMLVGSCAQQNDKLSVGEAALKVSACQIVAANKIQQHPEVRITVNKECGFEISDLNLTRVNSVGSVVMSIKRTINNAGEAVNVQASILWFDAERRPLPNALATNESWQVGAERRVLRFSAPNPSARTVSIEFIVDK